MHVERDGAAVRITLGEREVTLLRYALERASLHRHPSHEQSAIATSARASWRRHRRRTRVLTRESRPRGIPALGPPGRQHAAGGVDVRAARVAPHEGQPLRGQRGQERAPLGVVRARWKRPVGSFTSITETRTGAPASRRASSRASSGSGVDAGHQDPGQVHGTAAPRGVAAHRGHEVGDRVALADRHQARRASPGWPRSATGSADRDGPRRCSARSWAARPRSRS